MSNRRKGKTELPSMAVSKNGQLITKETCLDSGDHVSYGLVLRMLGGCRVAVHCASTNREHQCVIRGKMRGKRSMQICVDDLVLVALREFETKATGDIILRYSGAEIQQLKVIEPDVVALLSTKSVGGVDKSNVEFQEDCTFDDI